MNQLNDSLPTLMHRATEDLEPVSIDLLDRTVRQGLRLRRRRTTVLSVAGAGAVLATTGLVAGGIKVLDSRPDGAVAAPAAPAVTATRSSSAAEPRGVTPKQLLSTLERLVSGHGRTLSDPVMRDGGNNSFIAASVR